MYDQIYNTSNEVVKSLKADKNYSFLVKNWNAIEVLKGGLRLKNSSPLICCDFFLLLVSIPPKYSVSQFMGYLKGKSSLMIFDKHANLKYKFGNRHFRSEGYYVSTVGLNEATIAKYIREQEAHDIAIDKVTEKEYEDPFKGGK